MSFSWNHLKKFFFEILYNINWLYWEKPDRAQVCGKKLCCSRMGRFYPNMGPNGYMISSWSPLKGFFRNFESSELSKKKFMFSKLTKFLNCLWTCILLKQILNYFTVSGRFFCTVFSHDMPMYTIKTDFYRTMLQPSSRAPLTPHLIFNMPSVLLRDFELYLLITGQLKSTFLQELLLIICSKYYRNMIPFSLPKVELMHLKMCLC